MLATDRMPLSPWTLWITSYDLDALNSRGQQKIYVFFDGLSDIRNLRIVRKQVGMIKSEDFCEILSVNSPLETDLSLSKQQV